MTNSLPADLAQFVQNELAAGHYQSIEELFCDSLRLLRSRQEQISELRREIQPALDELDRNGGTVVKLPDLQSFLNEIAAEVKADLN